MWEGLEESGVLGELLQKYGQGGARGSTFRITMNVNQKEQKWEWVGLLAGMCV